jgi:predicted nucleotidyltransferase component of viral defense system
LRAGLRNTLRILENFAEIGGERMKILQQHEQMEMLILDEMRKIKIIDQLIFGGGTMLRLCFDLPRYSVDLDFYLKKEKKTFLPWARKFTEALRQMGLELQTNRRNTSPFCGNSN